MILDHEFELLEEPIAFTIYGLTVHFMDSRRFEMYRYLTAKHSRLSKNCLLVSILLADEVNVKICLANYMQLLKVPNYQFDQIHNRILDSGFLANSDDILYSVLQNLAEFAYVRELPIGKPTRFKAKIKAALDSKIHSNILDRFERSMGIVWTRDMLSPEKEDGSDTGITQTDKVFMPLALMLSDQPQKMMENLRKRLRIEPSEPDRYMPPPVQTPAAPPKEGEKAPEQTGPKEIILSKQGEKVTSLMNFDKSVFKKLFLDEESFVQEFNL